jgi:GNAT superfamily N-acetyltransferase
MTMCKLAAPQPSGLPARKSLVRNAGHEDVARFVELGLRFYAEEGGRAACPQQLARFAYSHLGDETRIMLAAAAPASGFFCGVIVPHYFTGEPTAFKTAWYVEPGVRGLGAHLLRSFEAWAKAKGARRIIVAGRQERTLTLLERLGYSTLETVTSKDIPWQKQPFPSL